MALKNPFVLISIVCYNEPKHIVDCLTSLSQGDYLTFAIALAENAGQAAYDALVAELKASALLEPAPDGGEMRSEFLLLPHKQRVIVYNTGGNLGYAGGNNFAIRQPHVPNWEAVWILNADTFPDKYALSALAARQYETGAGMVGSRIVFASSGLIQTWGGKSWSRWQGRGRYLGAGQPNDFVPDIESIENSIDFIAGTSMYVTREFIDRAGLMNEDFFMFCEDVEWCLRVSGEKFRYAHGSIIEHIHGGTTGSSSNKRQRSQFSIYMNERNKALLERKYRSAVTPLVLAGFLLIAFARYAVAGRSLRNFHTAWRAWKAGVSGETGIPSHMLKQEN